MKKFIFSVFFLLGFIALGTSVSAQSAGADSSFGFELEVEASDFRPTSDITQDVRSLLPQLYAQQNQVAADPIAAKNKLIETMLYKGFTSEINEGRPAAEAYALAAKTFLDSFVAQSPLWESNRASIVESFNNIVLK